MIKRDSPPQKADKMLEGEQPYCVICCEVCKGEEGTERWTEYDKNCFEVYISDL